MKIKRNISKGRIFIAFTIALLMFLLGISLGLLLDSQRLQWADRESKEQRLDYESLQWQYLFLTSADDKESTCLLLKTAFDKSVIDLGESLEKVQMYRDQSQINDFDYQIIERNYLIDNLKYWLLSKKYKKECGADYVLILYFYSGKNCPVCPDQGVILTHYKKIYEEKLLVFPIDVDQEAKDSSITMLKALYNVTAFPTIVVDEKKYSGVVQLLELGEIICDGFISDNSCVK